MIIYYEEDIPQKGHTMNLGEYKITIEKATPNRIILVRVDILR